MSESKPRPKREQPPAFTCPRCGARSWNPHDAENGYCARCHWWTGDPLLGQVDPPT